MSQLAVAGKRPVFDTNLIAGRVLDVFRAGERDPAKICAAVLTELGIPLPEGPH